ncbi:MAG TPA: ROK family protein [Acidimicrobiales bacterium]|nr:ROK family protein [Acidimicrobiales bacterium]
MGGTKLAAGLVTAEGDVVSSTSLPTPVTDQGEDLFDRLLALVHPLIGDETIATCGVGCGGPMSADGALVSPLNIPAWSSFPLLSRLEEALVSPTFVDNDAKALALAEGWCGAAARETDYLAMVVSTGVGGGIVLDGRLLDGAQGNAGHIGHVIVEPDGRICPCGARGCLEAEASGTSIAAATGRPAKEAPPDVVARVGTMVGRAVGSVANLLDLQFAVVGGSVALGYGAPFFAAAQAEVDARSRLAFSSGARIEPVGLGANGPLVGAAAVGWRGLARQGGPPSDGGRWR